MAIASSETPCAAEERRNAGAFGRRSMAGKAQGLTAPVTSAVKLQSSRHVVYLLKDEKANGARGIVIGFLKVGYKKLFLLDQRGTHIEVEPLCVLDFYVHESVQRHGYGKEIFDFMLLQERVNPHQLAFDRPSQRFLSFLRKHYHLSASVPQVNNFVVFEGFFRDRLVSEVPVRKLPPKKTEGEIKPYSLTEREALKEEQKGLPWPFSQSPSLTRSLSVGASPNRVNGTQSVPECTAALKEIKLQRPRPGFRNGEQYHLSSASERRRTSITPSQQGMVARDNLYSRHSNYRLNTSPRQQGFKDLKPIETRSETLIPATATVLPVNSKTDQDPSEITTTNQRHGCLEETKVPPLNLKAHNEEEAVKTISQNQEAPLLSKHNGSYSEPLAPRNCLPASVNYITELKSMLSQPKTLTNGLGFEEIWTPYPPKKANIGSQIPPQGNISWTVIEQPFTAQWVRRKQEYRSTRPW
ncbi:alpha-tubulin N-acetyltransferase 1 isoform X3 [Polypterus senegalus]|uniref:alpha-tubulin N-acetyltransferase 1 isoform X3 n=1 Tax=Polypterus senegalus TaxID=55291 RepID=UPI001963BDB0|nr:alpha-tubulin N-acetyltransferase 1 isoform X3 [Polypterus senegalus]